VLLLQDFASADDARLLMESDARYTTTVGGQVLFLDYSMGAAGAGGQGPAGPALDWICDMCTSVNFARYVIMDRARSLFFLFG
jgi:RNA-binding protein 5/10